MAERARQHTTAREDDLVALFHVVQRIVRPLNALAQFAIERNVPEEPEAWMDVARFASAGARRLDEIASLPLANRYADERLNAAAARLAAIAAAAVMASGGHASDIDADAILPFGEYAAGVMRLAGALCGEYADEHFEAWELGVRNGGGSHA